MSQPVFVTPSAICAGVDVSAASLELCLLAADGQPAVRRSFANTPAGIRALLKQLPPQQPLRLCLEPTSRYHERLAAGPPGGLPARGAR